MQGRSIKRSITYNIHKHFTSVLGNKLALETKFLISRQEILERKSQKDQTVSKHPLVFHKIVLRNIITEKSIIFNQLVTRHIEEKNITNKKKFKIDSELSQMLGLVCERNKTAINNFIAY